MSIAVAVSTKVTFEGAAPVTASHALEVAATGTVEVTVPKGGSANAQIQPTTGGQVQLLLINSSDYTVGVTYEVDGSGTKIKLDSPQLFLGAGAVSLLGDVNAISFTNPHSEDVDVVISVARNATS